MSVYVNGLPIDSGTITIVPTPPDASGDTVIEIDVNDIDPTLVLPSYGFIPVRYNSTTNLFVAAQADSFDNTAIFVLTDIGATATLTRGVVLPSAAHGLTVGERYCVDITTAGAISLLSAIPTSNIRQRVAYIPDADNIVIDVEPPVLESTVATGLGGTLGFTLGI